MAFSSIQRIHFPVIASTNTWVKQNTAQLAPDPRTLCVVSTDHQTAGRGTGDRHRATTDAGPSTLPPPTALPPALTDATPSTHCCPCRQILAPLYSLHCPPVLTDGQWVDLDCCRKWEAEPGASILATLFFRVPQKTSQIPLVSCSYSGLV